MKQFYVFKTLFIAVTFFVITDNATAQTSSEFDSAKNVSKNVMSAQIISVADDVLALTYQEYACIRDLSISQQAENNNFNVNDITAKTIDASDLTQNGNGYSFYTAVIGIDAYPVVNITSLSEVSYWLTSRKKRRAAIEKSRSNTVKNLEVLSSAEPTLKYSSLYRGTIHTIKQMDKECKKTIYIYSDGAESYVYNFYDVKDWNAEYETIKKTLLADMKVPSIKNLEIVFVSSGRDEITVQSLRFWSRFFSEHGINTTVRASI